jgi:hypothetical protein
MKLRIAVPVVETPRWTFVPTFHLHWPGGLFRVSRRSTAGKTVAEIERRLAELDPEVREQAVVRTFAVRPQGAPAQDLKHLEWRPGAKESLAAFVARAGRQYGGPITTSVRVDAWIDESDL